MKTKKLLKQELLNQLYAPYKNCTACPLSRQGRKNVVFGTGNPDAKLMLIGEAPGAGEDAQGIPFIGRAGQLLNHALEAIGVDRSELYITNIVKCRPPKNRTPIPCEIETCKKLILEKQLKIICPQIICTLGAAATKGLLDDPTLKISKVRGKQAKYNGITILPTYHPAYILRNRKELKTLMLDITTAYNIAKKTNKLVVDKWWISGG